VAFVNPNAGNGSGGLHAGRYRNLTLRDCQFINYQPMCYGVFLDGTDGWNEWAHIDNCWFANCFNGINILNGTKTTVIGGGMINVSMVSIPNSAGITTLGQSDTLRVYGWGALEVATAIVLNGSEWEYAQIEGLRVEAHSGPAVGIQCATSSNLLVGSYYGCENAIQFTKTATGNRYLPGMCGGGTGQFVVDSGSGNTAI
jgi:hypothetical protein